MESTKSVTKCNWKWHTCCKSFNPHNFHIKAKVIFISNIHQHCTYIGHTTVHHNRLIQHVLQHYSFNTKAHTSLELPTSIQLQPCQWPTPRILLHSHIHTQDKCNFPSLPCSCQPFPSPHSDFAPSYQFFPPARELLLSKQLQWSRKLEVDNHDPQGTPHIPPQTNTWNISPASKWQPQTI